MIPVCQFSRAASLAVVFSVALLASSAFHDPIMTSMAFAEDQEAASKPEETDPDYAVPDGTPEEIMKFLSELKSRKSRFANRKEEIDHLIKLFRAQIEAGDKILAQDATERVAANAAKLKLSSLMVLARNHIGDAARQAIAAVTTLKSDKRERVTKIADEFWMPIRILTVGELEADGRKELTDEILASVAETQFAPDSVDAATELADSLVESHHTDEAGELYDRLARHAKRSNDSQIRAIAKMFEGTSRRIRLPGQFMAVEGKCLNGDEFDWASYRGKVVLVDFWATWCSPCVAELPNLKKIYKKYHDKGFEVVAISLDRSRKDLDRFLEAKEIPWVHLYDEETQKGRGWNHPVAEFFGVNAIPLAILVDQEGKVVSLKAHGDDLAKLLEKLLTKAD